MCWDISKIAPLKGVMRFGKKNKLSPQFIGSFEILEKVGFDLLFGFATRVDKCA